MRGDDIPEVGSYRTAVPDRNEDNSNLLRHYDNSARVLSVAPANPRSPRAVFLGPWSHRVRVPPYIFSHIHTQSFLPPSQSFRHGIHGRVQTVHRYTVDLGQAEFRSISGTLSPLKPKKGFKPNRKAFLFELFPTAWAYLIRQTYAAATPSFSCSSKY